MNERAYEWWFNRIKIKINENKYCMGWWEQNWPWTHVVLFSLFFLPSRNSTIMHKNYKWVKEWELSERVIGLVCTACIWLLVSFWFSVCVFILANTHLHFYSNWIDESFEEENKNKIYFIDEILILSIHMRVCELSFQAFWYIKF